MKTKNAFLMAALMLLSFGLSAQPQEGRPQFQEGRPQPPQQRDPKEIATAKTDRMNAEINLDAKQYKKVYKLYLKDIKYRQEAMKQQGGPGMGGPGGGGPGMGGPGMGGPGMGGSSMGGPGMGGPGMGGSGMGGGRPQGGMSGGGPGMGGPGMGGPGQGGPGGPGMGPGQDVVTEEYLEKLDTKLRKILTADQYSRWRAKHPAEHLELPPLGE